MVGSDEPRVLLGAFRRQRESESLCAFVAGALRRNVAVESVGSRPRAVAARIRFPSLHAARRRPPPLFDENRLAPAGKPRGPSAVSRVGYDADAPIRGLLSCPVLGRGRLRQPAPLGPRSRR